MKYFLPCTKLFTKLATPNHDRDELFSSACGKAAKKDKKKLISLVARQSIPERCTDYSEALMKHCGRLSHRDNHMQSVNLYTKVTSLYQ